MTGDGVLFVFCIGWEEWVGDKNKRSMQDVWHLYGLAALM
jgi:hypothetical protein